MTYQLKPFQKPKTFEIEFTVDEFNSLKHIFEAAKDEKITSLAFKEVTSFFCMQKFWYKNAQKFAYKAAKPQKIKFDEAEIMAFCDFLEENIIEGEMTNVFDDLRDKILKDSTTGETFEALKELDRQRQAAYLESAWKNVEKQSIGGQVYKVLYKLFEVKGLTSFEYEGETLQIKEFNAYLKYFNLESKTHKYIVYQNRPPKITEL